MISRREFVRHAALTATSAAAFPGARALAADAADEVKARSIDRRNASSDVTYTLMVLARATPKYEWPGHAYFLVGEDDAKEKVCRFDKSKGFGFYPVKSAGVVRTILSAAAPVPGSVRTELLSDFDQKLITRRLDIIVAKNGYAAAKAVADKYPNEKDYQLGETDCVAFVHDVLAAVVSATAGSTDELKVPDKTYAQTPPSYLSALLKANGF